MHWHQPHTFSELTRAGLSVSLGENAGRAHWHVGDERREGTIEQRDAIARRGWDRFVDGVQEALPQPHAPLTALDGWRASIGSRSRSGWTSWSWTTRSATCWRRSSSRRPRPLDEAGAVSILRWHALSGYSLELAQFTGGRVTIDEGTGALLAAIAGQAEFEQRLDDAGRGGARRRRRGGGPDARRRGVRRSQAIVAVALNALGGIEFAPRRCRTTSGGRSSSARPAAGSR